MYPLHSIKRTKKLLTLAQIKVLEFYVLQKIIEQELATPNKYKPICKGWLIALLLAGISTLCVPFYFILKLFKR
jgi:hypothetical protein